MTVILFILARPIVIIIIIQRRRFITRPRNSESSYYVCAVVVLWVWFRGFGGCSVGRTCATSCKNVIIKPSYTQLSPRVYVCFPQCNNIVAPTVLSLDRSAVSYKQRLSRLEITRMITVHDVLCVRRDSWPGNVKDCYSKWRDSNLKLISYSHNILTCYYPNTKLKKRFALWYKCFSFWFLFAEYKFPSNYSLKNLYSKLNKWWLIYFV